MQCCKDEKPSGIVPSVPSAGVLPDKPPCCGPRDSVSGGEIDEKVPGFLGWLPTGAGTVPRIGSNLNFTDHIGACKARWGIGRMSYIVPSGLYAVGFPSSDSPVLVTANYKMSYDIVRQALAGKNVWLLVLETFGINVWCAAGKGTFGTNELVKRIQATALDKVVTHRRLILPILGAPGVAAHEVRERTGFTVKYGTIRAEDLPAFLENGMVTTPSMRESKFAFYDRLVLIPLEIVLACRSIPVIAALLFLAAYLSGGESSAVTTLIAWFGAVMTGLVIAPLLLPWLPGRSFALKGGLAGIVWTVCVFILSGGVSWGLPTKIALFLVLPAVSAYYTLNFTGCTNFTSRSGVKKELSIAIPTMGIALFLGVVLLLAVKHL
jgi:CO dehydrogenase/acetyl-CoA synthase delta subunit